MTRPASPARARRAGVAILALSAVLTAGCTADAGEPRGHDGDPVAASESPKPKPAARISANVDRAKGPVAVDKTLEVKAVDGTLKQVTVRAKDQQVGGRISHGGALWRSTDRLEPGLRYQVKAVAVDDKGLRTVRNSSFQTENLPLDRQTYPSIAPLQGETVGVGMPVIVKFDVPVADKASIERHLSVTNTSHQKGAWHWISSNEVHWRPVTYWKPGTDVTVKADINSIPAGDGVYGQVSRSATFHVGDSVISKVDVAAHQMKVFINGGLARTMPISAGKPGFITRSGTKVIIEKIRHKVMDSETVGIPKGDPEYYKIDVDYAMRVTYSGEFLHAAPWSTGSQGVANVSHGCVGMTTDNAAWLFNITKRGDVVEVTGSDRHMTLTNGYGDWNESFQEYAAGSAL
ncbi:MAG TPA: Ig-like domain-containing protein [Nocardioidaceae bacterium]|nr:Ig-like domain-containing protein [Nocardioidaceae bacterium]